MKAFERKRNEQLRVSGLECENWNLKYPVGVEVTLRKDTETIQTKTRSKAYVSDSGHAVCFFEGVRGWYLLERATPKAVPEKELEDLLGSVVIA